MYLRLYNLSSTVNQSRKMIGSIIGAGMQLAGGIIGGINAAKSMKKYRSMLEQSQQDNTNWYNRRYNEDATQRADAQRALTQTEDAIKERYRQAAGTAAVTGGTEESVAATKAASAKTLADATASIAAAGKQRKDNVESTYLSRNNQLNEQIANSYVQQAQQVGSAIQGAASAAGGLGSAIDDFRHKEGSQSIITIHS
jgi:hypothetical protein